MDFSRRSATSFESEEDTTGIYGEVEDGSVLVPRVADVSRKSFYGSLARSSALIV